MTGRIIYFTPINTQHKLHPTWCGCNEWMTYHFIFNFFFLLWLHWFTHLCHGDLHMVLVQCGSTYSGTCCMMCFHHVKHDKYFKLVIYFTLKWNFVTKISRSLKILFQLNPITISFQQLKRSFIIYLKLF